MPEGKLAHRSPYEYLTVPVYLVALLWINVYICRELFSIHAPRMNSMHGFWIALAERAGGSWFHSVWWPYWDCGIPFEFTYQPFAPGLTAAIAALRGITQVVAFEIVTGLAYCLVPVTLFLMAWLLTRAPGYSFAAALFYSLTSPTQLLAPESTFALKNFWDVRRLFVMALWDDTPHVTALVFLPLTILFLSLSIRRHRPIYYSAAALSIGLSALASAFGPTMTAMAALCLLFVLNRASYLSNIAITIGIGAFSYAISCPFLSPSLLKAIRAAAANSYEERLTPGSLTAIAITIAGWILLWHYLPRWTSDWRLQFFALFAYITSSAPMLLVFLNRQFLPQPGRYRFEMELAWALLAVFGLRHWFEKAPGAVKAALLLLLVALAGEQIVSHRKMARTILIPADLTRTIEYRVSTWVAQNLPGTRVMLPGSIAQWANAFTDVQQFGGSSWSLAANQVQQLGREAIYRGGGTVEQDAQVSLLWLKAFGVGAIAVSGPKSQEFWKGFTHPAKFDGVLPLLWRADDVSIYQVSQPSNSLAHVVPQAAILSRPPAGVEDRAALAPYVTALEDPSMPPAAFQWKGRNRISVRANAAPGQAISVQVSYHPGWHATVNGHAVKIRRDALGLMWFLPESSGPCSAELTYNGGWELRICRFLSYAALIVVLLFPVWVARVGNPRHKGLHPINAEHGGVL
ncbi:MAG: hypothetical protein ACR2NN_04780 [Bryobacteraceae bacterium]